MTNPIPAILRTAAALAILATGCSAATPVSTVSPSPTGMPQIIDRMGELPGFFEQTADLPPDERVRIFKQSIIEPNRDYYAYAMGISDEGLARFIRDTEPGIDSLMANQDETVQRFGEVLARFREKFPAVKTDFRVYLLPSLGLFKGIAVPGQGHVMLLLGVDALAGLSDTQFRGYITHELFHAYHFQLAPAVGAEAESAMRTMTMPPLWGLLWTEGLASHAVRMVYPETPEEEVLDWGPLIDQTRPLLPGLAKEARRVLTSDAPQDVAGFFYFPRESGAEIPTGCGYYLGMLVAGALAEERPVEDLIGLDDETLIGEIDAALARLEE